MDQHCPGKAIAWVVCISSSEVHLNDNCWLMRRSAARISWISSLFLKPHNPWLLSPLGRPALLLRQRVAPRHRDNSRIFSLTNGRRQLTDAIQCTWLFGGNLFVYILRFLLDLRRFNPNRAGGTGQGLPVRARPNAAKRAKC